MFLPPFQLNSVEFSPWLCNSRSVSNAVIEWDGWRRSGIREKIQGWILILTALHSFRYTRQRNAHYANIYRKKKMQHKVKCVKWCHVFDFNTTILALHICKCVKCEPLHICSLCAEWRIQKKKGHKYRCWTPLKNRFCNFYTTIRTSKFSFWGKRKLTLGIQ